MPVDLPSELPLVLLSVFTDSRGKLCMKRVLHLGDLLLFRVVGVLDIIDS